MVFKLPHTELSKNSFVFYLSLFALFILLLILFFVNPSIYKAVSPQNTSRLKAIEQPLKSEDNNFGCGEISYTHKDEFTVVGKRTVDDPEENLKTKMALKERDALSNITSSDLVGRYDYSPTNNKVAYIEGARNIESEKAEDKVARVFLYSLDTKEKELILEFPVTSPEEEYVITLIDVGFSNDGSLLAITSSDSLFIYNLETGEITKEFTRVRELGLGIGGVFSYVFPRFSPDDSKILLSAGIWEGTKFILYDLNSGGITDLPYAAYFGWGETALSWYNTNLVILKIEDGIDKLYYLTPDLKEEFIMNLSELINSSANDTTIYEISGSDIYLTVEERIPIGQYICYEDFDPSEIKARFESLYKLNLEKGELTKLLGVDATNNVKIDGGISIRGVVESADGSKLYIKLYHRDNSWWSHKELYINKPYELTDLII